MILVYIYRRGENFEQLSPLFITLIFDIFVNATDGFSFIFLHIYIPAVQATYLSFLKTPLK